MKLDFQNLDMNILGTCKVRNEIETKPIETKRIQSKRNQTKRNQSKPNEIKIQNQKWNENF